MSNFLIVNGVAFPTPMRGMNITTSQTVDSGRNTNNEIVGQLVGRKLWKLDGLQWSGLDAATYAGMKAAIEPFFVPVTFTGDDNQRHTIYMYPGDAKGTPLFLNDIFIANYSTCSFNLIDCGW